MKTKKQIRAEMVEASKGKIYPKMKRELRAERKAVTGVAPGTPYRNALHGSVSADGKTSTYYHVTRGWKRMPTVQPSFDAFLQVIKRARKFKRKQDRDARAELA